MTQQNTRTTLNILDSALRKQYAGMDATKRKITVREMLFAPESRMIDIDNGRKMGTNDLRFVTANALETPTKETTDLQLEIEDLRTKCEPNASDGEGSDRDSINLRQAQNIEIINSGIDPVAEYFLWLDETTFIIKKLNDGFITKEEAMMRECFLELTNQREADLMACLGLYESCKSKESETRIRFIRYKLQKLREMRTSIKFLTSDKQDVQTLRSEYDTAIPYYKYFKSLQKLPFGYDMPYEQKVKLGISHNEDEDLREGYNHYADILNEMLDQMRADDEQSISAMRRDNDKEQNVDEEKNFAGR